MWNGFVYSLNMSLDKNSNDYELKLMFWHPDEGITGESVEEIRSFIASGEIMLWDGAFKRVKVGEITAEYANISEYKEYRQKWKSDIGDISSLTGADYIIKFLAEKSHRLDDKDIVSFNNTILARHEKFYKYAILSGIETTEVPWENLQKKQVPPVSTMFRYNEPDNVIAGITNSITYYFWDIGDLVLFDMIEMEKRGIELKQCQNCGKYFVPESRSDEIYCNNIFKNNRTCRQIGYENKINNDEVLREYRKIYKTQNARKQRNKDNINGLEERFARWASFAKEQLIKCQNGEISVEKMKTLISTSDWMKGGDI